MLEELEPVEQVRLVAREEQPTPVRGHPRRLLLRGQLRPELHPAAHDAVALYGDGGAVRRRLEVVARVRLANVRGEGALELRVALASEKEVVVPVKIK